MKNEVHIEGTVKRDCEAYEPRPNVKVMTFCLMVPDPTYLGASVFVDCFAATDAVNKLEGYVQMGEKLAVDGRLTFRTTTGQNGKTRSSVVVYVDDVTAIEE